MGINVMNPCYYCTFKFSGSTTLLRVILKKIGVQMILLLIFDITNFAMYIKSVDRPRREQKEIKESEAETCAVLPAIGES